MTMIEIVSLWVIEQLKIVSLKQDWSKEDRLKQTALKV